MNINVENVARTTVLAQTIVVNVDLNSMLSAQFAVVHIGTRCSAAIVGRLYLAG